MSATHKGVTIPDPNLFVDSLESEIAESLKDPEYRAAFEDSSARYGLIAHLVRLRKSVGLTQKQVARRMGVGQSTIAGFETDGSDPRLSTLQRYSRAIEARCVVSIQVAIECDWVKPAPKYSTIEASRTTRVDSSEPSDRTVAWAAQAAQATRAESVDLAA